MKIGIITLYYNNPNYGGLLQSFALQQTLSLAGCEAEQISYDLLAGSIEGYSRNKYIIKNLIKRFVPGFHCANSKCNSELRKFEKTIPHSKYVDYQSIISLNSEYDAFICGSDQIWNPIGWQPAFFLSFGNKPKISYAASIARECLTEEELAYLNKHTKDFLSLSVREKNNAEYLTEKLGREYKLVPDPTLLLTRGEWNERFPDSPVNGKSYIFAYFLGFNEKQRNECIDYAKKLGMDIYFIPYMKKESYEWDKNNIEYCVKDYSVGNFVNVIRNAELVLTDSFHGAVFSCVFEKPFYVLNRQLIGNEKPMNSRMETLFYELGIPKERMTDTVMNIDKYGFSVDEIEHISMTKTKWREIGLEYLKESFEKI